MKQPLLLISAIVFLCFSSIAQTITLQPDAATGKDAQLIGATGSSLSNFGTNAEFMAFSGTINAVSTSAYGLLQFDLSSIPANAVITSATLSLYAYNLPGVGGHTVGNNSCYLSRVTSAWDENTVTWNTQPGFSGAYQISIPSSTSSTQNYSINVVNLVQEIVNGAVINYGWHLKLQTATPTRAMVFASSDNATASLRPKLVVTYATCASLPAASISTSGSTNFCSNSNVTLNASPTGTGMYSYLWYFNGQYINGATGSSYVASIAGNYQCLVRTIATSCSKLSNTLTLTAIQAPTAIITPQSSTTFCTGGSVVLAANSGTSYAYQWKLNGATIGGATLQNYTASASGNYTVSVTSGGCTATSTATVVSVQQPLSPTITDFGITGFCGSTTVQLETQGGTSYLYQWFEDINPIPNSNTTSIYVGHDATYKVNITNSCGTYASAPITISDFQNGWPWPLDPYIYITPSGSTTLCSGMSVDLYISSITFSFFSPSFQWYKDGVAIAGAIGTDYLASAAGVYTCSVVDQTPWWCGGGNGPTVFSNFIQVTTVPGTIPTVSISAAGNTNFCTPGSVTLNSTVNTTVSYQWLLNGNNITGANSASYVATTSGNYSCRVFNSCTISTSSNITVTAQTLSQSISSNSLNVCTGSSTTISATSLANNTFQWKLNGNNIAGATSSTYAATTGGNYSCAVTNICGTTTTNTIVLTARPKPTAVISGNQTICTGGTANLSIAFTGTPNWVGYYFNGSNYTFFSTASNPYTFNVTLTASRTYSLHSTFNDLYCSGTVSGSAAVTVTTSPVATITPLGSTTFCSGSSVQLNANTGSGYSYIWKLNGSAISGATSASYTASTAGSYTVQVTSSCGTATSSAVVVTINPLPSATITPNGSTTFCAGSSVVLNAPGSTDRSYQWLKGGANISGAVQSSYIATTGGTYKVTVTNTLTGCFKTTTTGTVVTVNPIPTAIITPQGPTTFCAGGSVTLKANSGTGLTYQWKKNGTNISGATGNNYIATTAGTYKVKVTNSNGCTKISGGTTVTVPCRENEQIQSTTSFDLSVYPNPNKGEFTVQFSGKPLSLVSIEITDMLGRIIEHVETYNETILINKANIATGIYYLTAKSKEGVKMKKIIVSSEK